MAASERPVLPILPAAGAESGDCAGSEPFALMVLGDAMAPEFVEGEIIVGFDKEKIKEVLGL